MKRHIVVAILSMLIGCGAMAMEPSEKSTSKEDLMDKFNEKISSLLEEEEHYGGIKSNRPVHIMVKFKDAVQHKNIPDIIKILDKQDSRTIAFRKTYRPAQLAYDVYKGTIGSIVISPDDIQGISLDSFGDVLLQLAKKGGNTEFIKNYSVKDSVDPQKLRTQGAGYAVTKQRSSGFNLADDLLNYTDQDFRGEFSEMYKDFLPK